LNPAVRQARGAENHSRPKPVSTQKSQPDHTQGFRQSALRRAAPPPLPRAARQAAAIRPGRKSGKPAKPGLPPAFADSSQSRQSCTRETGPPWPAAERYSRFTAVAGLPQRQPRSRTKLAAGHAHRPGANAEASWDPAAGKKLSRNPRLSDQHQAVSRRPQSGMRSFPGEQPLHARSRSCKQQGSGITCRSLSPHLCSIGR
jgi:hypothetical protein